MLMKLCSSEVDDLVRGSSVALCVRRSETCSVVMVFYMRELYFLAESKKAESRCNWLVTSIEDKPPLPVHSKIEIGDGERQNDDEKQKGKNKIKRCGF